MTRPAIPRLGVNIDHVATLRNARGGRHPDLVRAAKIAVEAGADGITAHLREDRRHIRDDDLPAIMRATGLPLNLEMAATDEMAVIALGLRPHAVCLVPERREERTTEGGLDVAGDIERLCPDRAAFGRRRHAGLAVHRARSAPYRGGAASRRGGRRASHRRLRRRGGRSCPSDRASPPGGGRAALADKLGLEVHAGHGLTFANVGKVAALPEIVELNIGHFLIGEAIFIGLKPAIAEMRARIAEARR